MKNNASSTVTGQRYQEAYRAHYGTKDLRQALGLYKNLITDFPKSTEAEYSRTQIHNIVRAVVPRLEIHAAEESLAWAHLEPEDLPAPEESLRPEETGPVRPA